MRVERGEERKREKPQVEEIKKRRPLRNPFGDDDDDDIDDPMSFLRNKLLSKYVMPHNFFFISICSLYSLSILFIYVSSSLSFLSLPPCLSIFLYATLIIYFFPSLVFRYQSSKYQDDGDDSDMEANFDDIMKEERRRYSSFLCRRGGEIERETSILTYGYLSA